MLRIRYLRMRLTTNRYNNELQTSELFSTAGRTVKSGLVASAVVSSWTWAATLLTSSGVAYRYGVSGPLWVGLLFPRTNFSTVPRSTNYCALVRIWGNGTDSLVCNSCNRIEEKSPQCSHISGSHSCPLWCVQHVPIRTSILIAAQEHTHTSSSSFSV